MIDLEKIMRRYGIILIPLYLFLLIITIIPVSFDITTSGGLLNADSFVRIDNSGNKSNSINTVYVHVMYRTTLFQAMVALIDPDITVSKSDTEYQMNARDRKISGTITKNVSLINSVIVAYNAAGNPIEYELQGLIVHGNYAMTHPNIRLGDIITHIDGEPIENSDSFYLKVNSHDCFEDFYLTIIRSGETLPKVKVRRFPYKLECQVGLFTYEFYNITDAEPSYQFFNTPVTGPSGGLMQALSVYNAITDNDITKGLKIAGTGTISIDGSVGAVGGVYNKVITAHQNRADVFFYPAGSISNTEDALAAYATLFRPKMMLIGVNTFEEALEALENLGG